MKLLFASLILASSASVFAQDAPPAPATPPTPPIAPMAPLAPRLAILPTMGADVMVSGVTKQAPFTADESGESVKILPDGNRVVQSWTGKMARNSEGRIRRDITSGQAGDGAVRPMIFGVSAGGLTPSAIALGGREETNRVIASKIDAETAAASGVRVIAPAASFTTSMGANSEARQGIITGVYSVTAPEAAARVQSEVMAVTADRRAEEGKYQTRKESLGTRDFGGVQAEGTRVTTTIAAGAVGNDRELEVTSEVWFSKELGVVVYSKHTDPRSGEQTYQMTNIVRAEPDASLFTKR